MATWVHAVGIAVQLSLLLCAVLAASCSSATEPESRRPLPEDPEPEAPPGYEVVPVVNGGSVSGVVSWSGEPVEPIGLPVTLHPEVCGEQQQAPVLEIGRRGGVASTVIWIDRISRGRALGDQSAVLSVEQCAFDPHVIAIGTGGRITLRNADPFLHNVHGYRMEGTRSSTSWFSEALAEAASREIVVEEEGIYRLVDDSGHRAMLAWVFAFEHPYFAVSNRDGRFQILGIPPGQYQLRVWHEGFRITGETESGRPLYSAPIVFSRPVTVTAGHDTPVDFVITAQQAQASGD